MAHTMDKYFEQTVASVCEIVRFDSSLKPAEDGMPFGKETADCLAYFLDLAEKMGFETHNYDNYVGEVVFGEGKEFAVLAHLDVVPAGNGWKYPPFGGVINEDVSDGGVAGKKIWGRGTMDDKGPAVSCLYALKALKDEGVCPSRKIKLIVGCNEECGWKCMDHYKKVARMPDEGFTPDADFPVIYAEKGILHFSTAFTIDNPPFTALQAGERVNMVCDLATAVLTKAAARRLVEYQNDVAGTTFSYDNTTNILRVYGKSAHGSHPEAGANALEAIMKFFASFHDGCKQAYELLFADCTGLKALRDETGALTISPDLASFQGGVLTITSDVRFPATLKKERVLEKLAGYDVKEVNYQPPIYNDPNGKLISTLTGVFNKKIGATEQPVAIGGGTYARALQCGCAFGPEMAGDEQTIHQPNEYITFDRLRFLNEIYYDALKALSVVRYRVGILKPIQK